jgi:CHAT domain-containing protein
MKRIGIILLVLLNFLSGAIAALTSQASTDFLKLANYYYDHLRFDSAEVYYSKSLPDLKTKSDKELYGNALNDYAGTIWSQSRFREAELICRENLEICIELFGYEHPVTADAMVNLGALAFISGSFGMTTEYLNQAIAIYSKHFGPSHYKIAKAYEWLGTHYEAASDTVNARKYLWKSFNIWKKIRGENHTDLGDIYRYMGLYHKRFFKHDSAIICFNKAKELFDRKYGQANFQSVKCLNNLADIYSEHEELEHMVLPTYDLCFNLIAAFKSPVLMAEVMTVFNLAEYHGIKGDYLKAIELFNDVLKIYIPDFHPVDIFSNPDLSNVEFHQYLRIILAYKSNYFINLYREGSQKHTEYLLAALNGYLLIDRMTVDYKKRFVNLDDFLYFEDGYAEFYYGMAVTALEAFHATNDTTYLTTTLNLINKKSLAGTPLNPEMNLLDHYDIPVSLLEKRRELCATINFLKTRLKQVKTPTQKAETSLEINRANIELDRLYYIYFKENWFSVNDSDVNHLIYISELQKKLTPDDCLLIYTEQKPMHAIIPQQLLIIGITSEEVKTETVKGEQLFLSLNQLYGNISGGQTTGITAMTDSLYNSLMKPFEKMLQKNITIIPSPVLSSLAFDMLTIPSDKPWKSPDYLIRHFAIHKEFSLSAFYRNMEAELEAEPVQILAVAPKFNEAQVMQIAALTKRDTSLINLTGALIESNNISNYFETNLLSGFSATKQHFLDLYNNYNIIHLSTHGIPLRNEPQMMQLAFSANETNSDDHLMSFYEVLNLKLNADLVVLSACKTGFGKINHGLGSLSLNWAFNKAGARSSVISLWDVNDYASSMIMSAFYRNLSLGHTKPEALRMAKLEYLQSHDELMSEPYYWAGFEYYGPNHAVVVKTSTYNAGVMILLGILIIGAGLLFLYKKHHFSFLRIRSAFPA